MAKQKTSRKAFATTAAAVMAATAVTPVAAFAASKTSFPDVPAGEYADAINNLAGQGILNGFEDGTFRPNDPVLREQAAKILATALKLDATGTENYPDVSTDNWSYKYIVAVTKAGIFGGDENGNFKPFDNLTRQEAAKIIVEAFGFKGSSELTFGDKANIQSWAVPYVKTAVANGILKGDDQGNFNPNANIKRGDFALMIQRALNAVAAPQVESVSAINAYELKVTFNKEVDKITAEDEGNYTVSGVTVSSATVEKGGKSVVLRLSAPIEEKTTLVVTVDGVATKADTDVTFPKYATTVVVEDKTAPELVKVESVTNDDTASKVKLTFSEPVTAGTVKIDGESVPAIFTGGVTELEVSGLELDATKSHTVEIVNLTDGAGNVTSLVSKTFSITKDTTKPAVSSVQAYGDSTVLVTFSKKVDAATVTNGGFISLKDEALEDVAVYSVTALPGDETGTKFLVAIDKTAESDFYTNKTTRNLTVLFKADADGDTITDELGNKLEDTIKTVSLTKDTTAPTVTGLSFKKNAAGEVTSIKVTFSEALAENTNIDESLVTVVDGNGVVVDNFFADGASVTAGAKEVTFNLVNPAKLSGTYTFTFAKGIVTDTAFAANDSVAYKGTINFGTAVATPFELPANAITNAEDGSGNPIPNKFEINFGTDVKGGSVAGSATDVSRYTLNGKPLPDGTTITLKPGQQVAVITLPAESISKDDNAAVFTINGVQSLDGRTNKAYTQTVEINDNIAPVLTAASLTSYDNQTGEATFRLTFSEAVTLTAEGATVSDELVIKNNGATVAVDTATAATVPGYSKDLIVTVSGVTLNTAKSITITTKDVQDNDITDNSTLHNELKGDITVTVSK